MLLNHPVGITSRLLPGFVIGGASVSIEYAGRKQVGNCVVTTITNDGRVRYRWYIDLPNGLEFTGNDLASGVGGGNLQSGLRSLLSFLVACGESVAYASRTDCDGENAYLFPAEVGQWAAENSDELLMLACELEENPDAITE